MSNLKDGGYLAGQIGTIEFLLNRYPDDLSPEVKKFMQMVLDRAYKDASEAFDRPAEDIALAVAGLLEAQLTKEA